MNIRLFVLSMTSVIFLVPLLAQATPVTAPAEAQTKPEVVKAELVQCDTEEEENLQLDITIGQCTQFPDQYLCQVKFANSELYDCALYENFQG
ncbi:hypothetical protein BGZ95_000075, partial [Linnemannia exigua]